MRRAPAAMAEARRSPPPGRAKAGSQTVTAIASPRPCLSASARVSPAMPPPATSSPAPAAPARPYRLPRPPSPDSAPVCAPPPALDTAWRLARCTDSDCRLPSPSRQPSAQAAPHDERRRRSVVILDLEPLELNLFRGRSPQVGWQRVFGGQVIGQALVAAAARWRGAQPHSLHAYFLLPGDPKVPLIYEVDRLRDGKSFTTRRVIAIQHGHADLRHVGVVPRRRGAASTTRSPMPDVPAPE